MSDPVIEIPGYEFLHEIGVGGMANVYLCVQTSLQRKVAIKVMRRAGADANFETRFLIEGRAMARLPHRNIVGVFDIVQTAEINYIAMEYLAGGTLVERLREGLSLAEAISIIVQIANALQLTHDNGIVHRDLKPANILFRDAQTPVLTDFGIAQHNEAQSTRLTQAGMMVGTPIYMSPEQASDGEIDGRSDQYSLGILFYEMLAGEPPFHGSSPLQVALAHVQQPPPPLPVQFVQFQRVMDRLLAKKKDDRYPDMQAFVRELKGLISNSDTLLARVRSDPNQSASEQLRAIGFSDSQNTSRPIPSVPGPRTDPGMMTVALSTQGSGLPAAGTTQVRSPTRRWMPIGIFAVALSVLLAVGWYVTHRETTLDPKLRAVVADTLSASDRLAADGKLVSPPGDNAYEKLQTVLQVAPNLPEAVQRVDKIAETLRGSASAALAAGRFDEAQKRVDEALAVKPDDLNSMALGKQIAATRVDAERKQRIDLLLAEAATAENAGKAFGEGGDNAYALLRRARDLEPNNKDVQDRLATLTTHGLAPAQEALSAGRLDEAETQLRAVGGYLAAEPAWQSLLAAIGQARLQAGKQQQLATLIETARAQTKAGRLAEPAGDNALESLARVRDIDANDASAATVAGDVARLLAAQAADAEKKNNYSLALTRYDQALQATPANSDYLGRKSKLEQVLGAHQTEISRALAAVREAIAGRRFLAPAGDNAADRIDAVLRLDPGNADGNRLRSDLPRLITGAAEQMSKENNLQPAFDLLASARKRYPDDRDIAARLAAVDQKLKSAAGAARRDLQLAAIRAQLAKPKPDAAGAAQLSGALAALLAADPGDRDARSYKQSFFGSVGASIDGATTSDALAALTPVVAAIRKALPSDTDAVALNDRLARRQTTVTEQERALLAATSGELLVNAAPWADVASITDQRNQLVPLPASHSTPLRITLRAGIYRVVLKHPGVREPRVLVANIEAKKSTRLSAAFPTLTADTILARAGYQP